jgi:hypothetical protein
MASAVFYCKNDNSKADMMCNNLKIFETNNLIFGILLNSWNCILIILASLTLSLLLKQVNGMVGKINGGPVNVDTVKKVKLNKTATIAHIVILAALVIIEAISVTSLLLYGNGALYNKTVISYYFLIGVQDIFISHMIWFVLDKESDKLCFIENHMTGEVY